MAAGVLASWACVAQAQPATELHRAFEAAWARQPETQALPIRRDAARAARAAADRWSAEPAALELSAQADSFTRNKGARELEVGVSLPLWLAGERSRSQALADAELSAVDSKSRAAQLRVAASVREAWWALQRARAETDVARDALDNARRIAADVSRRLKAGDAARADSHQAEGAVAAGEADMAQAEAAAVAAAQQLKALTGVAAPAGADVTQETAPVGDQATPHAALAELQDRTTVAQRSAELAAVQSRANPELALSTTRDRGEAGEPWSQAVRAGIRWPLGAPARHGAAVATARADAVEAQALLALERGRLDAERESAQVRVEAARAQLGAAERRAQLARESRGFFDKSFQLGQSDLPTRLRVEAEAVQAERQAARSRIELAAAVSAWRQALGLLPQ